MAHLHPLAMHVSDALRSNLAKGVPRNQIARLRKRVHATVVYLRQRRTRRSMSATMAKSSTAMTAKTTIAAKTRLVCSLGAEMFIR